MKHGLLRLIWLVFIRLWRNYINNRDIIFYLDLDEVYDMKYDEKELTIVSYENLKNIPQELLKQLIQAKCEDILIPFFESFFRRGAILWLGLIDKVVVGYKWTVNGGFEGFNAFPLTAKDSVLMAAEVLHPFRGKNINSRMTRIICSELRKKGITRIYWSVGIWNTSELRSSAKIMNAKRIGIVRTYSIFGRWVTIWNKKSLWQTKI